ncbi:hypothetical protein FALCPG4_005551 [Fusarium falciforme]
MSGPTLGPNPGISTLSGEESTSPEQAQALATVNPFPHPSSRNAKILNSDTGDDLMQTLSLTSYQYTIALMLFLVAYSVFEPPSNLALKVFSPRRWLGFLVFAFGAFCTAIGAVHGVAALSALRFLLGAAEAGVFPGMIYYFTFWYKPEERALRIAAFLTSATLAGAFGGCIAYGVGRMNGAGGLQAWRWLFILEGIPSVIVGTAVFFFLPSYPEQSKWLTPEEKRVQSKRMGEQNTSKEKLSWADAKVTLMDVRLYAHYIAYTCVGCIIASLSLFAPTIVLGLGFEGLRAQLFTVPPYATAFVFCLGTSMLSDRWKARGLPAVISLSVCSVAFITMAALQGEHFTARYILLIIATSGGFAGLPALCAWIGDNLNSTTALSLATAINVAFSGPGQIIGVWIYRPADKPFYRLGHGVNAGAAALSASICLALTFYYRRLNAKQQLRVDGSKWIA